MTPQIMLRATIWTGLILHTAHSFTVLTSSAFTPLRASSTAFDRTQWLPIAAGEQTSTRPRQHGWYYGDAVGSRRRPDCTRRGTRTGAARGTPSMLLDFIKKRAQEGVEQTQNLVTAAQEGRLEEALKATSEYVKDRYN